MDDAAGRALWVPPGERHAALAHGATRPWSLYVSPPSARSCPHRRWCCRGARSSASWYCGSSPGRRTFGRSTSTRSGSVGLRSTRSRWRRMRSCTCRCHARLVCSRVARALTARLDDARELDSWAHEAAMSKRSFTRHFREETGLSFAMWRTQLRMLKAVERLAAGISVTRPRGRSRLRESQRVCRCLSTCPRYVADVLRTHASKVKRETE